MGYRTKLNWMTGRIIGHKIRKRRKAEGLTQEQLGSLCGAKLDSGGWSKQYISQLENAVHRQRCMRIATLFIIAESLGISIEDLLPTHAEIVVELQAIEQEQKG